MDVVAGCEAEVRGEDSQPDRVRHDSLGLAGHRIMYSWPFPVACGPFGVICSLPRGLRSTTPRPSRSASAACVKLRPRAASVGGALEPFDASCDTGTVDLDVIDHDEAMVQGSAIAGSTALFAVDQMRHSTSSHTSKILSGSSPPPG